MSLIRKNAFNLASIMRVLTLATSMEQETWTAPVYYVFLNKQFYFFSNPDSRHIKEIYNSAVSKNLIVTSIFLDDKNIKGLKMQGEIVKVEL